MARRLLPKLNDSINVATKTRFLRRDTSEVQPWAETCGQVRCLIEEKDEAFLGESGHNTPPGTFRRQVGRVAIPDGVTRPDGKRGAHGATVHSRAGYFDQHGLRRCRHREAPAGVCPDRIEVRHSGHRHGMV